MSPNFIKGKYREVCQKVYKLFSLPENKNYILSKEKKNKTPFEERYQEWLTARPLFIPKTKTFKNFEEPVWTDVDNNEAQRVAPEFITVKQARKEWKVPLELGKDYKIQATQIDLDMNGTPETIYRSVGKGYQRVFMDEAATDFMSVHFSNDQLKGTTQIVLYKGEPFFLERDMGLSEFMVLEQPFKDKADYPRWNGSSGAICVYTTLHNRNLD